MVFCAEWKHKHEVFVDRGLSRLDESEPVES